jgi:hypothetical protein
VLLAFLPPDEQAAALEQIDFTRRGPKHAHVTDGARPGAEARP